MAKNKKIKKIILITALSLVGAILLAALSYVIYVFCNYYRVEDRLTLEITGNASEKAPTGQELNIVTYNIGFGAYSDDYSFFMDGGEYSRAFSKDDVITNTNGAISAIKEKDPDFAIIQEVDVDGTRSYHVDQTEILRNSLSGFDSVYAQNYDSPYFLYPFSQPIGANKAGFMTFSGYDITSSVRRSLPIEDSLYKLLDLDRAYSVSMIPTSDGKTLCLYNFHLSAYTSDGSIADEQLKMLASDMLEQYKKGNYVIAGGDFNKDLLGDSGKYFERSGAEDYTWAKPLDTSLLPEGFSCHTGSNSPTCRNADSPFRGDGTDFVLSVDGFIVSDNIRVVSCDTVDLNFAYSDHDPVSMKFILGG